MFKRRFATLAPDSVHALSMVCLIGAIAWIPVVMLPIFVGTYIDHLGFSDETSGWVVSANIAGIGLISLIVSLRCHHWSMRRVAACGLVLVVLTDLSTLFVNSLAVFTALRFLSGIGSGAAIAAATVAVGRLAVPDRGYGMFGAFVYGVQATGMFSLPLLLPDIGYGGFVVVISGLALLALILTPVLDIYTWQKDSGETEVEMKVLLHWTVILTILAFCIYGIANGGFWAFSERIGLDAGLDHETIGMVLGIGAIEGIAGSMLVYWIEVRFGRLLPLSVGIGMLILVMFILINVRTEMDYIIAMLIFTGCYSITIPYFLSIQADIDPGGTVVLFGQFMNLVGISIGPALAGTLIGISGVYTTVLWMAAVLFFVSWLLIYGSIRRM